MDETSAPAAPRRANPFGVASVVAGVLLLAVSALTQALAPAIPAVMSQYDLSYRAIPLLMGIPSAVLAVIAVILGIIGLIVRGRPRIAATIGLTLGASHIAVALVGTVGAQIVTAVLN